MLHHLQSLHEDDWKNRSLARSLCDRVMFTYLYHIIMGPCSLLCRISTAVYYLFVCIFHPL